MGKKDKNKEAEIITLLKKGGVGILPTDTIYGLCGQALNKSSVEKIYKIKGRKPDKPLIVLISSLNDLNLFKIKVDKATLKILKKYWPGKVSIILSCPHKEFEYLHRGTQTLAFRLPDYLWLCNLIKQTGPLTAPSANPEGLPPAKNIQEARNYFGDKIGFYFDRGDLISLPSTLISVDKGRVKLIREGGVKV